MRAASSLETRYWLAAIVAFALVAALGAVVSSRPPTAIDVAGAALRGEGTPLAAFFTALGRTGPLVGIAALAVVIGFAARTSPLPVAIVFVAEIASQGVVAAIKPLFHRLRPDHWLLYRETDFSFPSGHATTSIVFFLALGFLAMRLPGVARPLALGCAALAWICTLAIPWSRLALGAHYVTDVAGGLLVGAGTVCVELALVTRFGPPP